MSTLSRKTFIRIADRTPWISDTIWYKPWTWFRKTNLVRVTNFLLFALDEFINVVDDIVDLGEDKKATVLDAISSLYDYTIREALPIWLKPFAGSVKRYIIFTLISAFFQ